MTHFVGLDIGGANLKAADNIGTAVTRSFPLWQSPDRLPAELQGLLAEFPRSDALAVTMTAELADCFQTKREGVEFILQAVEEAAGSRPVFVWQTGAEFVSPQVAREIPLLVAAANWHALATWMGRMVPNGAALLIDVGSTTSDVIPLFNGVPVPNGLTDLERLQAGELVYSGVRRTPLCSLARSVPFRGGDCPLATELFATTLDLYLTLGQIPEDTKNFETANGKPATADAALDRLARMLCCDRTEFRTEDAQSMAAFLADVQLQQISGAVRQVMREREQICSHVLLSGSGSFLAERIVANVRSLQSAKVHRVDRIINRQTSEAACAYAVAQLAAERQTGLI